MKHFSTNLLREKFVIKPLNLSSESEITALSNRMVVPLINREGEEVERFTIRGHNMHQTVRMAARINTEFVKRGALLNRLTPVDWPALWKSVTSEYESVYNDELWGCVYHKGKPIFRHGDVHVLLDIIEKCHASSSGSYESSVHMAEQMFSKAGKDVKIGYDGNVALVVNIEDQVGRFGIILRGAGRTTTFNFSVRPNDEKYALNYSQALVVAACFLEGMQLAFMIGMNNIKLVYGQIARHSKEEKQTRRAKEQLAMLAAEISNLENVYDVHYRPERPEFHVVTAEAESLAEGIFAPTDDDMIN